MADEDNIGADIVQARARVASERSMLSQKREEINVVENDINSRADKVPMSNQSRLRNGLYSGLEGRKRREVVSKISSELASKKSEISAFRNDLKNYEESQLNPFESQINQREQELQDYNQYLQDVAVAKTVYGSGKPASGLNSRQKEIYNSLVSEGDYKIISKILSSPSTPASVSSEDYILSPSGEAVASKYSPSVYLSPPRGISRTQAIKDFNPLRSFTGRSVSEVGSSKSAPKPFLTPMTPAPSAFQTLAPPVISDSFRTTGSPLRVTKISSLKSRGYIPSSHSLPGMSGRNNKVISDVGVRENLKIFNDPRTKSFISNRRGVSNSVSPMRFVYSKPVKKNKAKSFWGF